MNARNDHTIETPRERQGRHKAMEAVKVLDTLREYAVNPPEAMAYFYELHWRYHCDMTPMHEGKTKVGTMCIQVPYEVIDALGAAPVRLCNGFYTDDEIGGEYLPSKSCPLVKATVGAFATDHFADTPDLVVTPTTCDQKTKATGIVEEMGYPVYEMEFPRVKESEESREYWRRSVRNFTKTLSKELKTKLTRGKLKASIQKVGYAQTLYHRLNALRKAELPPISGNDMFLVTNAFFFDKTEAWSAAVERLLAEMEARVKEGIGAARKRSPRIVYTGSPPIFPNLKVPQLIEMADAVIVADESCSSNRLFNDMVSVDEWFLYDMVDAVADRYLKGCTCPVFTRNDDRIRRIVELVKEYSADGVVYQAFAGCQVYEMEQRSVLAAMEKEGIPILYLESDYSPSQLGQLTTRVEAFVESLKSRKRRQ
ncbi:double-cubane-cluster-containing anaerobic reductase [Sulfurimonas sp. HSL1-6]|uniref:double-cubane-cluster-containing anaerobic reductase n=1 Tax=Thiomicrolovo immobilis TaxID=3131935 RepID=UPI0031F8FF7B